MVNALLRDWGFIFSHRTQRTEPSTNPSLAPAGFRPGRWLAPRGESGPNHPKPLYSRVTSTQSMRADGLSVNRVGNTGTRVWVCNVLQPDITFGTSFAR